jgi:hypothetical protein
MHVKAAQRHAAEQTTITNKITIVFTPVCCCFTSPISNTCMHQITPACVRHPAAKIRCCSYLLKIRPRCLTPPARAAQWQLPQACPASTAPAAAAIHLAVWPAGMTNSNIQCADSEHEVGCNTCDISSWPHVATAAPCWLLPYTPNCQPSRQPPCRHATRIKLAANCRCRMLV